MDVKQASAPAPAPSVDLKGGTHGVLLFHGLCSSPLELVFIARGLHRAGYTVRVPSMPGYTYRHGKTLQAGDWVEAAVAELESMRAVCDTISVGGLCLGGVLAMRVASLRSDKLQSLLCLSPSLHYDGWGNPWHTPLLPLARYVPFAGRIRISEREPFGLKDERMRGWVAKQMRAAGESDAGAASLQVADILQARELIASARRALPYVQCPTLVVHAQEDENATPRSAMEVIQGVSSTTTRLVLLKNSYHMISIDQEKDTVLREMRQFLADVPVRAAASGARGDANIIPFNAGKTGVGS